MPLLVSRRPLEREPAARVTSMLLACMNGVLSAADLAEVTGIPPGAMVDALADLEQRGVIVLLRR